MPAIAGQSFAGKSNSISHISSVPSVRGSAVQEIAGPLPRIARKHHGKRERLDTGIAGDAQRVRTQCLYYNQKYCLMCLYSHYSLAYSSVVCLESSVERTTAARSTTHYYFIAGAVYLMI
jgi:hypothetical protein